ncbi:MAG: DNA-processing protein DprA, partial [Desulfobacterales bacterium]|nr:DNA-processing protein DprA [Desulfobacterales bacterium]
LGGWQLAVFTQDFDQAILAKLFLTVALSLSNPITVDGQKVARVLSAGLVERGFTIVSGLARGVDTAAHRAALKSGGRTIAVLGSGLDRIYPAENEKLYHRIAQTGAVVSEFALGAKPEAHHFPMRNRIISGMSLGTVVAEASRKSGSLITARLAAEQNREVFAVPGSVQSFKSTGTHTLIKQGAKLVEHAQDIIEELAPLAHLSQPGESGPQKDTTDVETSLSPDEAAVFHALEPYPVHIDDLARKTGLEPGKLLSILLKLELQGIIQQQPGKLFSIIAG